MVVEDLGGGTGNHICQMLERWSEAGWEITLVTQTPPLVRTLPAGIDLRVITRAGWYDRFPLAQVRRLAALIRILRALRPDVMHTYFFWPIIYGRVLKLLGHIQVLVENREDMGFGWGRVEYAILRLTRAIPDRVICVAEAVRRLVLECERILSARAMLIHNGIAVPSTAEVDRTDARRRFGFDDGHVVVGMVANLPRAVKGGARLLDAVAGVVDAAPNVRFLLLGLGTEHDALEPELEARGIRRYVVGAGYRRDVDACYAAMDISVLTSSMEGLSITILESMRHGLPLVVTKVGGNPEAVLDGVTGFLVPLDDRIAFIDRVVTLARDGALRRAMGEAGRLRVARQFAIASVARRYLDVYTQLLETGECDPGLNLDLPLELEQTA